MNVVIDPDRAELDRQAFEYRRQCQRATAYVATYRRRGALVLPIACERCAGGASEGSLHAWHPDPLKPREVAWVCRECRRYIRAAAEEVESTWRWPGSAASPSRGRPRTLKIEPELIAAAAAESRLGSDIIPQGNRFAIALRRKLGSKSSELFWHAQHAASKHGVWCMTGDVAIDDLLRQWQAFERASLRTSGYFSTLRCYTGREIWERRPRSDRRPSRIHSTIASKQCFRSKQQIDADINAALDRLTVAEAAVDALFKRYNV